jgi:hypothetical protein
MLSDPREDPCGASGGWCEPLNDKCEPTNAVWGLLNNVPRLLKLYDKYLNDRGEPFVSFEATYVSFQTTCMGP